MSESPDVVVSSPEISIQLVDGQVIIAEMGAAGPSGPAGLQGEPGMMPLLLHLAYDPSTVYQPYEAPSGGDPGQPGSAVPYNGSLYMLWAPAPAGTVPTNADYWVKLVSKGDQGIAGPGNLTYKGQWDAGTSYSALDAVSYSGSLYAASINIASGGAAPNTNSDWQIVVQAGQDGPAWIARTLAVPWSTGEAYLARDGVFHNGSFYRCKSGHTSSNSNKPGTVGGDLKWDEIASRGLPGADSTVAGPAGKDAVTFWALHFPNVSGTRRLVAPEPIVVHRGAAVSNGTGSWTLYKNGTAVSTSNVACVQGDRLAVVASGVVGDFLLSLPITKG